MRAMHERLLGIQGDAELNMLVFPHLDEASTAVCPHKATLSDSVSSTFSAVNTLSRLLRLAFSKSPSTVQPTLSSCLGEYETKSPTQKGMLISCITTLAENTEQQTTCDEKS